MDGKVKELTKLKGVGAVLAARFVEAGLDGFDKVAAAGEEALKGIRGINPRAIPAILAQAADLAGQASEARLSELREKASCAGEMVRGIAEDVRNRFGEELAKTAGKKVEKDILRILGSLDSVAARLEAGSRKAGKVISKFEKRLSNLEGAGFRKIRKGLKKTRKMLKRSGFMERAGK